MRTDQLPVIKISLIIILLITGLIYLKTSSFGFVNWDDDENIRTNVRYKELNYDNMKYHFQHSRYKALAIWSFMADSKLFGTKTSGFHIHNVLLHLVNILLVFVLIKRVSKKDTVALITAGLFALHPVFIEPAAWVTGRKDLLFVLFSLLALLSYLKYLKNLSKNYKFLWLIAVATCTYLASLAKIQAFTLPLLFLGLGWFYERKITFSLFAEILMFYALILDKWIIFGLLFLTIAFINNFSYLSEYLLKKTSKKTPTILFWYLLVSLFILTFNSNHLIRAKIYTTQGLIIYLIFIAVYGAILFAGLRNKSKIISKLSSIKINWQLFLFITPVFLYIVVKYLRLILLFKTNLINNFSNHFWTIHPGSENYFTFWERLILAPNSLLYYVSRFFLLSPLNPMVPYPERSINGTLPVSMITTGIIAYIIFIVITLLLIRYFRKNKIVILGCLWFLASISIVMHFIPIEGRVLVADRYAYPAYIGLFMILGSTTDFLLQRFKKTYIIAAMIIITLFLSIKTYADLDTWKSSKTLWERALKANPKNHYAMYSLSLAYFAEDKNPQKSLQYLDNAIKLKEDFQYYNNRGRIRYAVKDLNGALEDFNKSIELDSSSFAAYNNLGAIQQQMGNLKNALTDFDKAISLNPNFDEAINNRAKITRLIIIDSIMINNIDIPPEKHSEVIEFINYMSEIYIHNKDFDKAAFYLLKGINLEPTNQAFYEKLAVMYQLNKEYVKAMEAYNRGLSFLPSNPTLLCGRGILYLEKGDTVKACTDFKISAAKGDPDAAKFSEQICRD